MVLQWVGALSCTLCATLTCDDGAHCPAVGWGPLACKVWGTLSCSGETMDGLGMGGVHGFTIGWDTVW